MSNTERLPVQASQQVQQMTALYGSESATLSAIMRAASDPTVDVHKLDKLLQMQYQMLDRQSQQGFNVAMAEAQAEIVRIAPDKKNSQTGSWYATYATLDRTLRPIYSKHGFSLSFDTAPAGEGFVTVVCYVSHIGGHTRTYRIDMPADGKGAKGNDVMTKTHATGSGASYGMRYLLKMIFNVAVGVDAMDDDGNGAASKDPIISEVEEISLRERAEAANVDMPKFLAYLGVERLSQLPQSKLQKAKAALSSKERANNG